MQSLFDGFNSTVKGMNGAVNPSMIEYEQYALGINVTCRGGVLRTRPPFIERNLTFEFDHDERNFRDGKMQGGILYNHSSGSYMVSTIRGHVFLTNIETNEVFDLSNRVGRLNQYVDRVYFCQVEQYMIIQDGSTPAVILDGTHARRSDVTNQEVPVGTYMAYGHGRLFIVTNRNTFIAGDINQAGNLTAVLKFSEKEYLNEGSSFSLPADLGDITGMVFTHEFNTGTGDSPLLVLAENGIASYAVNVPRKNWLDSDLSKIQYRGPGSLSHYTLLQANQDLLFRGPDGLRSFMLIRSELMNRRRFTSLSDEIRPFTSEETPWMIPLVSGGIYDNRVLFSSGGRKIYVQDDAGNIIEDYYFSSIISLDLSPVSTMNSESESAYDGLWTGLHPTMIVTGMLQERERCFIFDKSDEGKNRLFELRKKMGQDNHTKRIRAGIVTKSYPFKRVDLYGNVIPAPMTPKKLNKTEVWLRDIQETVDVEIFVKPDQLHSWTKITGGQVHAPIFNEIFSSQTEPVEVGSPQSRSRLKLPAPDRIGVDPILNTSGTWGYDYQFMIMWEGSMELYRMNISADESTIPAETHHDESEVYNTSEIPDWYSYRL